ncbi:MAG: thiamine pyrophosphate-binding protein, partial [Candidatus Nanopelagicales bacterium]
MMNQKYAEIFVDWLIELGYTTCFFVAGGNSMHLLDSCRKKLTCIPFVHEVSGGIASEYFNQVSQDDRSFVLITAGPGLTNMVTSLSGAWLESRELLVVGGQVKSSDLATGGLRQRGVQEVDGISIVKPITKTSVQITKPLNKSEVFRVINYSRQPRKGPCFIEMCLDVQASSVNREELDRVSLVGLERLPKATTGQLNATVSLLEQSQRPVLLIGGGVSRKCTEELEEKLDRWGVPILTTWNGADRYASDRPMWFGRPDTWGMRFANAVIQKSDLVVALGARLSLQQTGFNWQGFAPLAKIVHVELDQSELDKGHPTTSLKIRADADDFLSKVLDVSMSRPEWLSLCELIKNELPLNDPKNSRFSGFIQPFDFVIQLSKLTGVEDVIIPCSSGGANTVMMQAFQNKTGQYFFNNKALASMGYGLAGSIGAALANRSKRTVLIEGDGGFSQNLQELATVSVNNLNIKMFIFANNGYASIRMTQKNYFEGAYLGCDTESGLGVPDWEIL